ncbi:hypothetical protein BABINDRAFT_103797 [Babjeviella inositovora NRRL Y-12698]|uniref:Uncharacterized protein n=1 Tax=Babjeviella inositovora NRRL Y-12698 TaxID=984486 RepID=A0A1E3QHX5_9ASCO|nr:uncharacterized protein BABINDRAFT_103797 [Babjeviella inositovora NRRL Y-12698]ODQ77240.1 hypothetical protein BABINDRAFT_103797 [Babjeviella inositovora NRRL Y-12698]
MEQHNADLFRLLSNPSFLLRIEKFPPEYAAQLHFTPDALGHGARSEILLNKKALYFKFFKPNHDLINGLIGDTLHWLEKLAACSGTELEAIYHATCILLLVTNDHHTILGVHKLIVYQMVADPVFIETEFSLLQNYLLCNLDKINKSSTLWLMYKKVVVIRIANGQDATSFLDSLLATIKGSGESHYQSYYAWEFCSWLSCLFRHLGSTGVPEGPRYETAVREIYAAVSEFCHSHPRDHSAWTCLGNVVMPSERKLTQAVLETMQCLRDCAPSGFHSVMEKPGPRKGIGFLGEILLEVTWISKYALNQSSSGFIKSMVVQVAGLPKLLGVLSDRLESLKLESPLLGGLLESVVFTNGYWDVMGVPVFDDDLISKAKMSDMVELYRLVEWLKRFATS